jgi:hypothetical protein
VAAIGFNDVLPKRDRAYLAPSLVLAVFCVTLKLVRHALHSLFFILASKGQENPNQ